AAHHHATLAVRVRVRDVLLVEGNRASGEVRSLHVLEQVLGRRLGIIDQVRGCGSYHAEGVRGNRGRHTHRDPKRPGQKEVRCGRRQHFWLALRAVKVWAPRYRILLEVTQELLGDAGHLRLGVPVRGGAITVDRAEVPLP